MRLTPLDVRKQEFRKGMRGLDADEVYAFLATVADEYEAAITDNKALRERLLELDDKVQEYRNMEKTLRDTLLTAERVTVESKDTARREAGLIIKEAQFEAEKGARDVKEAAMRLRQEIQHLKQQRDSYLARMKAVVESHLKYLAAAEGDFAGEEQRLDDDIKKWTSETEVKRQVTPKYDAAPEPRAAEKPMAMPVTQSKSRAASVEPAKPDGRTPNTRPEPPQTVYRETIETDRPSSQTGAPLASLRMDAHAAPSPADAHEAADRATAPTAVAIEEAPARTAKPSLKELLDRVIDHHVDEERSAHAPAPSDRPSTNGDGPAKVDSKWSLSRLKNDILARSQDDEEDRSDD